MCCKDRLRLLNKMIPRLGSTVSCDRLTVPHASTLSSRQVGDFHHVGYNKPSTQPANTECNSTFDLNTECMSHAQQVNLESYL